MTWTQLGPILAPILGLLGVVIASKLSSKSAKDGVIIEGYDELVSHYRSEVDGGRVRFDNAIAEIRRLEKENRNLENLNLRLSQRIHDLTGEDPPRH